MIQELFSILLLPFPIISSTRFIFLPISCLSSGSILFDVSVGALHCVCHWKKGGINADRVRKYEGKREKRGKEEGSKEEGQRVLGGGKGLQG